MTSEKRTNLLWVGFSVRSMIIDGDFTYRNFYIRVFAFAKNKTYSRKKIIWHYLTL